MSARNVDLHAVPWSHQSTERSYTSRSQLTRRFLRVPTAASKMRDLGIPVGSCRVAVDEWWTDTRVVTRSDNGQGIGQRDDGKNNIQRGAAFYRCEYNWRNHHGFRIRIGRRRCQWQASQYAVNVFKARGPLTLSYSSTFPFVIRARLPALSAQPLPLTRLRLYILLVACKYRNA